MDRRGCRRSRAEIRVVTGSRRLSPSRLLDAGDERYEWRGPFSDEELEALHAEAFGHEPGEVGWSSRVQRHSLGWVCARRESKLLGFVNVVWDGGSHAFLLDTIVAPAEQGRGVGTALVAVARSEAAAAGCEWLHVDFEARLRHFYLDCCNFGATAAGVIHLKPNCPPSGGVKRGVGAASGGIS